MSIIFIKEKGVSVEFPDGTTPDVMEKAINDTFFTKEEVAKKTTFLERESYRLDKGSAVVDVGSAGFNAMIGKTKLKDALAFETNRNKRFTFENDEKFAANNLGEKFVGATTELLPYMFSSVIEGIDYGNKLGLGFAGIALAAGQAGPQIALPEEIVTVPSAALAGKAIGQVYGAWQNAYRVEGGNMFLTMVKEGVDPKIARQWAGPAGAMIGAIELLQVGQLFNKFIPGAFKLGRQTTTNLVIKAAKSKGATGAMKRFFDVGTRLVKNITVRTGLELAEEEAQEIVSLAAESMAHLNEAQFNLEDSKGPTFKEASARMKDTFVQGLLGFPLLGLPGSIVSTASGTRSVAKPITKKGRESLKKELKPLVEAAKAEDLDTFIKDTGVDISEKEINELGFDNQELMMEAVAEEGQKQREKPTEAPQVAEVKPGEPIEGVVAPEVAKVKKALITPSEKAKEEQIRGRIAKLDSDLKQVRKQIDSLDKQRQRLAKKDVSTKALENEIKVLQKREDIIDSELGELLTTQKELITLRKEKIEIKAEVLERKEAQIVKEKLRGIAQGIREGTIRTKKEIKATQTTIIDILGKSDLEAKDKAKFISTIKNIQTPTQLSKAIPKVEERIAQLEQANEKRTLTNKINKELKTTKPVKKGQKRVSKFDPESNKLFDSLRDINKLTKENAQIEFDKFAEEGLSELDLIKKRFASLKANGVSASVEIHNEVLSDIAKIKELGQAAKDEADLFNKINREDLVLDTLSSIENIKADKRTIKTKIGNAYRNGFSNIFSMLNSIAGKSFAEKFNPELSENRKNTAIYKSTLDMTLQATKIYNEKNVMRLFENMSRVDFQITDIKDELTIELSKLELIDIYNAIKNDKNRDDYFEAFGEDQVQNLMAKLTTQDELFGDSIQEAVQSYRGINNQRHIEITGRDLGFIENYWPGTSEHKANIFDDIRVQGETPSAQKERAKTKVIPVPNNAWYKAQRHIAQAEHVDKLSREFETLKRIFTDRRVKNSIEKKFGKDVYTTLLAQIDNISLNKQTERIDAISGVFQKAINNWVTAKISLNPATYVRQLMSVGNYVEKMDVTEWTKGFFEGISSPKKTFQFVWENAPFLEARFNKGFSEALQEAIEGAERISVNKQIWTKTLTALVRSGDVTAIIYGGFPLIKSELAKHGNMKKAIDVFEKATLKAQQSGLSSSISQFQNSRNPFARLFLAFKNTSNQYFRKMVDSVISFQNGDISINQFSKTMGIYAVIQPILYVSAGYATKLGFGFLGRLFRFNEEDEDFEEVLEQFFNDIMLQMIVSPVNAIPIIDDVVKTGTRKLLGQKIFKVFSTPLLDDLENGLRALVKKEVTGEDYLKVSTSILEPSTGAPIGVIIRYIEILMGKKILKKKKPTRPKI